MKYGLEIVQTVEGEKGIVVAVDAYGEVLNGQAYLNYSFDDATYELKIENGTIFQKRTGDVNLSMLFIQGRETVCSIEDGAMSGQFTVFTKQLEVNGEGGNVCALCVYTDCQDDGATKLDIKISPIEA